jgi:hypothetical protein
LGFGVGGKSFFVVGVVVTVVLKAGDLGIVAGDQSMHLFNTAFFAAGDHLVGVVVAFGIFLGARQAREASQHRVACEDNVVAFWAKFVRSRWQEGFLEWVTVGAENGVFFFFVCFCGFNIGSSLEAEFFDPQGREGVVRDWRVLW